MSDGFYKSMMLDDEHFQEIELVLEVKLSNENKQALHVVSHEYLSPMRALVKEKEEATGEEREAVRAMTTPKMIKNQLQTILQCCSSLRQALKNTDDITSALLFSYLVSSHPNHIREISKIKTAAEQKIRKDLNRKLVNALENSYAQLPEYLRLMENAAAIALKNSGQHNGRTPDYRFNLLLSRLLALYEDITGREATLSYNVYEEHYSGKLFDFCDTFLKLIGREKDIHSNKAFGRRLLRLISIDKSPVEKS